MNKQIVLMVLIMCVPIAAYSSNNIVFVDTGNNELLFLSNSFVIQANFTDADIEWVDYLYGSHNSSDIAVFDTTNQEIDIYDTDAFILDQTVSVGVDYNSCSWFNTTDFVCSRLNNQFLIVDYVKVATGVVTNIFNANILGSTVDTGYGAWVGNVYQDTAGDDWVIVGLSYADFSAASIYGTGLIAMNLTGGLNVDLIYSTGKSHNYEYTEAVVTDTTLSVCDNSLCYEYEYDKDDPSVLGALLTVSAPTVSPNYNGHYWTDTGGIWYVNSTGTTYYEKDGSVRTQDLWNTSAFLNDAQMIYASGFTFGGSKNVTISFYPSEDLCGTISGLNNFECCIGAFCVTTGGATLIEANESAPAHFPSDNLMYPKRLGIANEVDTPYWEYNSNQFITGDQIEYNLVWGDSRGSGFDSVFKTNLYHMRSWHYQFFDLASHSSQLDIDSIYWDYQRWNTTYGAYPIQLESLTCGVWAAESANANMTIYLPINTTHWFTMTSVCNTATYTVSTAYGETAIQPDDYDAISRYDEPVQNPEESFYAHPNGQVRRLVYIEYDLNIINTDEDLFISEIRERPNQEEVNYTYTYTNNSIGKINFLTEYGDHVWSCTPDVTNTWSPEQRLDTIDIDAPFKSIYTTFENSTYDIGMRLYFTDDNSQGKNGVICDTPYGSTVSEPYNNISGVCVLTGLPSNTIIPISISYQGVTTLINLETGGYYNQEGLGSGATCSAFKDDPYYIYNLNIYRLNKIMDFTVRRVSGGNERITNANITLFNGVQGKTDNTGTFSATIPNADGSGWAYVCAIGYQCKNQSFSFTQSYVLIMLDGDGNETSWINDLIDIDLGNIDTIFDLFKNPVIWGFGLLIFGMVICGRYAGAHGSSFAGLGIAMMNVVIGFWNPAWGTLLIIGMAALLVVSSRGLFGGGSN